MTRLERISDRNGCAWATLTWQGDRVERIEVARAAVVCSPIHDVLLGEANAVVVADELTRLSELPVELTRISAIDWARPTQIPAIAAPGRLPAGAGGAIMNVLAILAERAGIATLRYAGPYPTSALWRTLARSFRTTASEAEFIADLPQRMTSVARHPIEIDFVPAPHERLAIAGGHIELRGGIERIVIDGVSYERDGSPARLVDGIDRAEGEARAELWFGDSRYAEIVRLAATGEVLGGPHPPPACTSDVIGKPFPAALVSALAELVADAMPPLLARDAPAWFAGRTIEWADLGARAARLRDGVLEVHAALWQHVAPHGLARLAHALTEAVAPLVTSDLVVEITRATVRS